jgi:putative FmdB family regulatory protein
MPIFEYRCEPCNAEFEETLTNQDEIKEYANWYTCPGCGEKAARLGVSLTNFNFKGGVRGESGVHGQSGVHDLDYPMLDKAIGRSAEKRWTRINTDQAIRDKVRKETGSNEIAKLGNTFVPADTESLKVRETGLKTFKKMKILAGD